jgi:hypothetical protein
VKGKPRDWDDDQIVACAGPHITATATNLGVPRPSLDNYLKRNPGLKARLLARCREIAAGGAPDAGGGAMPPIREGRERERVTSDDPAEWGDIDQLLRSRGLDPDEWVVVKVRVNEWGENADGQPLRQLRVDLEPRSLGSLMPARTDGWRPPPSVRVAPKGEAELVVFFGDQHCPHHDPGLHEAACQWLRRNKPARGVLLGDLLDFDAVSRHRANPEWATSMQQCIDSAYAVLRGFVQASPGTRWQMVSGNHEDRLRNAIIDQLRGVYGLARATDEDEPRGDAVLSVKHLLRLDELGVEWVGGEGEYAHQQIKVSPHLAARHGWIVRKGSGTSARATLEHLGYSCVIGHTHRQSQVFHTHHDIDGSPSELVAVEAGTMSCVQGGLGYAVAADWQAGFATARIWPDGTFSCDLAKWVNGSLVWANQRLTPAAALAVAA